MRSALLPLLAAAMLGAVPERTAWGPGHIRPSPKKTRNPKRDAQKAQKRARKSQRRNA